MRIFHVVVGPLHVKGKIIKILYGLVKYEARVKFFPRHFFQKNARWKYVLKRGCPKFYLCEGKNIIDMVNYLCPMQI